jgi:excisionase family DNA binding protein
MPKRTTRNAGEDQPPAHSSARRPPPRWLTLKEASEFLGVHFTTLRTWADRGELRVFRTPGGHRRFSLDDLRRFLDERDASFSDANGSTALAVVDAAIVRVREELQRLPDGQLTWRDGFRDQGDAERRQRGRRLFALALNYVLKPAQRERTLLDGRRLGLDYGREAALNGISLAETGRAVQFFRGQLLDTLRGHSAHDASAGFDADDMRIHQLMNHFLDEVLYAVLDGYETATSAPSLDAPPSS